MLPALVTSTSWRIAGGVGRAVDVAHAAVVRVDRPAPHARGYGVRSARYSEMNCIVAAASAMSFGRKRTECALDRSNIGR